MPASFGGRALLDPHILRQDCQDRGIPTEPWFGQANSFRCPLGEKPSTGAVLMERREYAKLTLTSSSGITLRFIDQDKRELAPQRLTVLSTEAVTPGAPDDPDAALLVRVVDRRHHLAKVPIDKGYNLKASDGQSYLSGSLNSGSAWTWETMLTNIWNVLRAAFSDLPTWPGLPFAPHGTPENFSFFGDFAWRALNYVLGRLACAVRYDPVGDTFAIIQLGATDTAALAAIDRLKKNKDWDEESTEPHQAWMPDYVRVLFLRRPAPTAGTSPYYTVDVDLAAVAGVITNTYVTLLDDLVAVGDIGVPSNSAACAARAAERAADWLRQRSSWGYPDLKVWEGVRTDVRTILGKTYAAWSVEDRGRGVLTSIMARPAEFPFEHPDEEGGTSEGINVCGSPVQPPFATPAGCPVCDLDDEDMDTIEDVRSFIFEPCHFIVERTDDCGAGSFDTGASSGGVLGRGVRIKLAGKTETMSMGKGDPVICDNCTIVETLRHACFYKGSYRGYYDDPTATCGSGSGS